MLADLCLAQAQYLFYKKAVMSGMKAGILSKTSMQVSEYFKNAYQHSQTNTGIKLFDSGRFCGVMHYHSYYFEAMAYLCLAIETYKNVAETSKGIGLAMGYYSKTLQVMDGVKSVVMAIPPNYQDTYNKKINEVKTGLGKAKSDNDSIYFEKVIGADGVTRPDAQNFVKMEPMQGEIDHTHNIENQLRHIIPPQVRVMQEELRGLL